MVIAGYIILWYLVFCLAFGPTATGKTFAHRMVWLLKNFTWKFWALLILALVLICSG